MNLFPSQDSIASYINSPDSIAYKTLIAIYAERYIELTSMIFDLYPFIPFLSQTLRQGVFEELKDKVEKIEKEISKARARVTLWKVRKVFGLISVEK